MPSKPSSSEDNFLFVAGSYEGGLVGIAFDPTSLTFEQLFGYQAHIGAVKTLAVRGRHLATGGSDEVVHLYNVHSLVEAGGLSCHSSSVTSLSVLNNVLVSCSSEGELSVSEFKSGEWSTRLTAQAHKGSVTSSAIHPSGRLAVTVATDGQLKMWDLMRGTCASVQSLASSTQQSSVLRAHATSIALSPSGSCFALLFPNRVQVASFENDAKLCSVSGTYTAACMLSDELLIVGDSKGSITVLKEGLVICSSNDSQDNHSTRIKAICPLPNTSLIATACAQGKIIVWRYHSEVLTMVAQTDSKVGRLTCFDVTAA